MEWPNTGPPATLQSVLYSCASIRLRSAGATIIFLWTILILAMRHWHDSAPRSLVGTEQGAQLVEEHLVELDEVYFA